jgi:hypothetical protein
LLGNLKIEGNFISDLFIQQGMLTTKKVNYEVTLNLEIF